MLTITRLNLTDGPPQIDESDFDTPLPAAGPETEGSDTDPVYYHLFMAMVARAHYRFRRALRWGKLTRAEAVRQADIELADVIIMLPDHLQPDTNDTSLQEILDAKPWIQWQRFSITLVLLNLRMRMHSSLRLQWLEDPEEYGWARSVSVKAATEIIWISYNWDQPPAMRNQWWAQDIRSRSIRLPNPGHYHFMYLAPPVFYSTSRLRLPMNLNKTRGRASWRWPSTF
jgi:hypothetical protein